MKLQQLLSYTRKAVDEYQMIEEGDHIAVGISGGKDSLALLYALHGLKLILVSPPGAMWYVQALIIGILL